MPLPKESRVTGSRARSARSDSDDNRLARTYSDSDNPAQMLISLATDQLARGPQRSAATEVPLTIGAKASGESFSRREDVEPVKA
jgi:hypothetical protein